jgi:hypothetical protein
VNSREFAWKIVNLAALYFSDFLLRILRKIEFSIFIRNFEKALFFLQIRIENGKISRQKNVQTNRKNISNKPKIRFDYMWKADIDILDQIVLLFLF